jgi:hypothetical protein
MKSDARSRERVAEGGVRLWNGSDHSAAGAVPLNFG